MSFFSDPELYLVWGRQMGFKFYIFRIQTKPGYPLVREEFCNYEVLNFSKHLSLPHNKESDFDKLLAYLSKNDKFVNCQGLVINWFSSNNNQNGYNTYSWSPEGLNLSTFGVHAFVSHHQQQQNQSGDGGEESCTNEEADVKLAVLEKRVAELLELLNQETNEKLALQKRLYDLTSK